MLALLQVREPKIYCESQDSCDHYRRQSPHVGGEGTTSYDLGQHVRIIVFQCGSSSECVVRLVTV